MSDPQTLMDACLDLYEAWLRGPITAGHGADEILRIVQELRELAPTQCAERNERVIPRRNEHD